MLQSDANLKTLLYTPIDINGVRFPRCLVDTGSKINLISVKDATKYGFSWRPAGIQSIKGFDGTESPVQDTFYGELRIGPCEDAVGVDFVVTSKVSVPIIGFPTLHELGLSMDSRNHELVHQKTGEVVRCSAIMRGEKN